MRLLFFALLLSIPAGVLAQDHEDTGSDRIGDMVQSQITMRLIRCRIWSRRTLARR